MFKKYSSEQFMRIATTIVMVATLFGVDLEALGLGAEALAITGAVIVTIFLQIIGFIQRFRKGDVTLGGFRKNNV